jgi:carboxyl-terminal processing protease
MFLLRQYLLLFLLFTLSLLPLAQAGEKLPNQTLPIEELQRFTAVIDYIKNYYVNHVGDEQIYDDAIRGVLSGLDPHSSYLDVEEFGDLKNSTSGRFGGIGVEVVRDEGFLKVITPIDDTPAQKAGILPGDIILKINDVLIKDLDIKDAINLMRGNPGSELVLTILRKKQEQPIQITVTRAFINVQSIKFRIVDEHYAYIRISQFQADTGREFTKTVQSLTKRLEGNLYGVVLDLRNNPGGVLSACVEVVNTCLDAEKLKHRSLIVYTEGRYGSQINEKAQGKDLLNNLPLVVLVNHGSASASEVVAGALQDHKRALIMGGKTFGKGSVQTVLPLKGKRGVKLTTALYYTAAGRCIQAKGITPDIEVESLRLQKAEVPVSLSPREANLHKHLQVDTKEAAVHADGYEATYDDYQLYEAIQLLKGLHYQRS